MNASMALRRTAAAMLEAAYKQLPILRAALLVRSEQTSNQLHDRPQQTASVSAPRRREHGNHAHTDISELTYLPPS